MDLGPIKQKIKQNEFLKKIVFYSITSPKNPKPRCWVKWFVNPWIHKKGKGAIIRRRRSRIDVFPWNQFTVGKNTVIEDFTTINNGAGDVIIGDNARIGIGSVVIGPVRFKNKVGLGQHVFISGFNHGYEDGNMDSNEQPLVKKIVVIDEDSHIGANSVVVAGVHILHQPIVQKKEVRIGEGSWLGVGVSVIGASIGKHCVIGSNAVVTKDIPDYSVAVGNPAKVIKRYDINKQKWIRI